MANPVGSILHARWLLSDNSDRSQKYSFGATFSCYDGTETLVTPGAADLLFLTDTLIAFLNTALGTNPAPLGAALGTSASRVSNASELVLYDIANALGLGELAGSPYDVTPFTLAASDGFQGLPEQVCQTVSWRAEYGSDAEFGTHTRPRANDRNRMFLGPLSVATITSDTEMPSRIEFTTAFLGHVHEAFVTTMASLSTATATDHFVLQAWSREKAEVKPAEEFSEQLYPTTQRRRLSSRPNLSWTPIYAS